MGFSCINTNFNLKNQMNEINSLPTDILIEICKHLDAISISAFSQTCRTLNSVANSDEVWKNIVTLLRWKKFRKVDLLYWRILIPISRVHTELFSLRHSQNHLLL